MAWTSRGISVVIMVLAPVWGYAQNVPAAAPLSGVNLGEFDTTKPGQLKWENNPFVQTMESVGVQDMHLVAIVYRPGSAAALINGRVMKKGDRIGDNEVVHIEAKRVVMRNADGIFSLTMGGAGR
jgi:hypothetical protein